MMKTRIPFLAAACAIALAACGGKPSETADTPATAAAEAAPAVAPEPADAPAPSPAPAAPSTGSDKPAAVVAECATEIDGNDQMQYSVGSIMVPASCTDFTITLKHTGQMPVAAMGHNVVISKASDMQAIAAEGIGAGVAANYVKAGDPRVIAHTTLIGGGESTSVSFPVSKIKGDGPYEFFCSFPGHSSIMKGVIAVQ